MPEELPKRVLRFNQIKAHDYCTKHVDGAFAVEALQDGVQLTFFIERHPIPQIIEHEIKDDSSLGEIVHIEGKEGIIREIQTGLILTKESAEALRDRLIELLKEGVS